MSYGLRIMRKNNSGELLINLLVSIGIILVMTTLAIPMLNSFKPNLALSSTIRDLTTNLRYAQQLTIAEQAVHLVDFDEINNSYQILKIDIATTTIKTVEFPSEVSYQSVAGFTNNEVRFNSYGGVNESGKIILINTNNKTKTINVKPSGYIQLAQ